MTHHWHVVVTGKDELVDGKPCDPALYGSRSYPVREYAMAKLEAEGEIKTAPKVAQRMVMVQNCGMPCLGEPQPRVKQGA